MAEKEAAAATSDSQLIELANSLLKKDKLLDATRLLRKVQDKTLLNDNHKFALGKAVELEKIVNDLNADPGPEWSKQGETNGKYHTMVYYKVVDSKLTARLETPIEPSLLVPLISVFNEIELYTTWLPSWEHPVRLGIRETVLLQQESRARLRLLVKTDIPWPLASRETLIDSVSVDDIDTNGVIVVRMKSPPDDSPGVPPPENGFVRTYYEGGILFRKCPSDHILLRRPEKRPRRKNKTRGAEQGEEKDEDHILSCLTIHVESHVKYIPMSLINFVTRTVLGRMWDSLLAVAQEIRDGKRPQHAEAIQSKRDFFYDWVDERVSVLLNNRDGNQSNDETTTETESEQVFEEGKKASS